MVNELAGSWSEKLQVLVHATLVIWHVLAAFLLSCVSEAAVVKHLPLLTYHVSASFCTSHPLFSLKGHFDILCSSGWICWTEVDACYVSLKLSFTW